MRLVRGVFGHHGKHNFAGAKILHAIFSRQHLAIRGKDGRYAHQILRGNAGVTQGQLERCKPLAVLPDSLGEEHPLGNHVFTQRRSLRYANL